MKFNYNPDNLGLLPDIMSFEVGTYSVLVGGSRLVLSGWFEVGTQSVLSGWFEVGT